MENTLCSNGLTSQIHTNYVSYIYYIHIFIEIPGIHPTSGPVQDNENPGRINRIQDLMKSRHGLRSVFCF